MLVDHFWKLIFALVVGVLCWFWWKDASAKKLHKANIAQLADLIDVTEGNEPKSEQESTERFFQAIAAIDNIRFHEQEDFDLATSLSEAIAISSPPSAVADLLKRSLTDAFNTADKSLFLLEDDDARSRLEDGSDRRSSPAPGQDSGQRRDTTSPPASRTPLRTVSATALSSPKASTPSAPAARSP